MHTFFDTLPDTAAAGAAQHGGLRCAPLTRLAVFAAAGADAVAFLQGQLTQDIAALTPSSAAFGGYCTAKGRLLGTMVLWRGAGASPDTPMVHAMVRADLAAALIKRLSMFVLRAKVKLAPENLHVAGVWTPSAAARQAAGEGAAATSAAAQDADAAALDALQRYAGGHLPRQPWQRSELPTGTWIAAPAAAGSRWWWIASDAQLDLAMAQAAGDKALHPDGSVLQRGTEEEWWDAELATGLPWVGTATQDLFIPQTVNLDLIGGVSFSKGCYPGQEVVARSHYRGTVKRRMAYGVVRGHPAGTVAPGTDVYDANRADEAIGRVVDAAGGADAAVLFETTLAALPGNALRLGAADGPAIELRPLPYAIVAAD
jgi:folate-binding protein YgfZ